MKMKPEQIAAIKKETEVDKSMRTGIVLNDTRVKAFIDALVEGELTIEDIVVQLYLMGWEDAREN